MKALLQNDKVMKEKERGEENQPKLKEYLNLRYREQQQLKRVEDKILTIQDEINKLKTREKAFVSIDDSSKEKVATMETTAKEITTKVDAESDKKTEKLESELQDARVDMLWWKPRTKSALETVKSVKEGINKYVVDPVREKISVDYSKESLDRRIGELTARFDGLKKEKETHSAKINDLEELIRGINPNILAVEELL
jgi:chromosome segregation ATPase